MSYDHSIAAAALAKLTGSATGGGFATEPVPADAAGSADAEAVLLVLGGVAVWLSLVPVRPVNTATVAARARRMARPIALTVMRCRVDQPMP